MVVPCARLNRNSIRNRIMYGTDFHTSRSISSWRYFTALLVSGLVCKFSLFALDTKLPKALPGGPGGNPAASIGPALGASGQLDLDASAAALAEKLKQLGSRGGVANR